MTQSHTQILQRSSSYISINMKLGIIILVMTTLILAGYGCYQYLDRKAALTAELQYLADIAAKRMAHSLIIPIWTLNLASLEETILSEMQEKRIARVIVKEPDGSVLLTKARQANGALTGQETAPPDDDIRAQQPIIFKHPKTGDAPIGTVTVFLSKAFMRAELRREIRKILITTLLLDLLLLVFLVFTLRRLLLHPISILVKTAQGIAQGNFSQQVDISQRDEIGQLADAFRNMQDIIGSILQERTADLMLVNEKLREAKHAADEAAQAKSTFLANMSHEIRTPMNAISGMTYLLQQTQLNATQQDYVEKIYDASQNLLGILNDILDFSKIEAGRLHFETVEFELNHVLDSLSNVTSMKAQEKGIELIFAIAPDVPLHLVGDPLRLEQILLNLTNNAIKFTDAGEIVISTILVDADEQRVRLQCAVRDTGIGMSQEQMAGLFQAFTQADASTTRRFGGSGLGLVICKRLVEMMRGEIWAESEEHRGSTLYFTAEFGRRGDEARQFELPSERLKSLRVLVADDNATVRNVLQQYLHAFSFSVTTAASGESLLNDLFQAAQREERPYTLLLLDVHIPDMNCPALLRYIENDSRISPKPAIVLMREVSDPESIDAEIGQSDCQTTYLVKPITQSSLFDRIMEVFGYHVSSRRTTGRLDIHIPEGFERVQGAKILLAEDNVVNQQMAVKLLEQQGFWVTVAENGIQTVQQIRDNPSFFDIILMDLQMPKMDGYEATRRIRDIPSQDSAIPIIAMTADAVGDVRERVLNEGMNDYIPKPVDPALLFTILVRWIQPGKRRLYEENGAISSEYDEKREEEFPDLPGLDTAAAIARLGGDQEAYALLLKKFCHHHAHTDQEIREALHVGDVELARRLAHTIKGVAGNIGADQLYAAAKDLETTLKQETSQAWTDTLDEMSRILEHIVQTISTLPCPEDGQTSSEQASSEPLPLEEIAAFIDELETLLNDDDTRAVRRVATLKKALQNVSMEPELQQLEAALGEYDFDNALDVLQRIRKTIWIEK